MIHLQRSSTKYGDLSTPSTKPLQDAHDRLWKTLIINMVNVENRKVDYYLTSSWKKPHFTVFALI